MIAKPKSFDEWQRMAIADGCAVRSVTAGMGGQMMYHATRNGDGSIGLWNIAANTGYLYVRTPPTVSANR